MNEDGLLDSPAYRLDAVYRTGTSGDDRTAIDGEQRLDVQKNRSTMIHANHAESVAGDQTVNIGADRSITIDATSSETVGTAASLDVGGGYDINVEGDSSQVIGGSLTSQVGADRIEIIGAARSEEIGGDSIVKIGGDFSSDIRGEARISIGADLKEEVAESTEIEAAGPTAISARNFTLEAEQFTLIVGGKVVLSLDRSGTLQLNGTSISIEGSAIQLKGNPLSKSLPDALQQQQLKVKRLEDLRIRKAALAQHKAAHGAKAVASFTLVDQDGKPLTMKRFKVAHPGGDIERDHTRAELHELRAPPNPQEHLEITFSHPGHHQEPPKGT